MNNPTTQFLFLVAGGMLSFCLTWIFIPAIVRVAILKNLTDAPGGRKTHGNPVPNLGGIAVFTAIALTWSLTESFTGKSQTSFLMAGMLIIVIVGFKDDIFGVSPWIKMSGQFIAGIILVMVGNTAINEIFLFPGFKSFIVTFLLSLIFIIFTVNAFNLIDGVDGLAGMQTIVVLLPVSIWYWINNIYHLATIGVIVSTAYLSFLFFNLRRDKYKIFMGDTGSLLAGYIISFFIISFIEYNSSINREELVLAVSSAPAVAYALMVIPLTDTLRVILVRIRRHRSPFKPDRNHIHHHLLDLGLSHFKISLILTTVTLIFTLVAYLFREADSIWLFFSIMITGFLLLSLPSIIKRRRKIKKLLTTKKALTIELVSIIE